jgi:N-acetyl-anhydromuramyl-L-alanine amidase AmpD
VGSTRINARRERSLALTSRSGLRVKVIACALLGSMTALAGAFWMIQDRPTARALQPGGISLLPMAASTVPVSREPAVASIAPLAKGRWTTIVIHHSGSMAGTPASIEAHQRAQGQSSLGYHFIIGNGNGLDDGEVFVAPRWLQQLPGTHVAGERSAAWNLESIGVCLVGDGRKRRFTDQQMAQLIRLVSSLCAELKIPKDRVLLHSDLTRIDDPGRFFPKSEFVEQLRGR